MNNYKYILDKTSKKNTCPECNKKTFVFYIDKETGEFQDGKYGRCDRSSKCGYQLAPPIIPENICFFVPFKELNSHTEKSYRITTNQGVFFIPKSQVNEIQQNGCFITEWYLNNNPSKLIFLINECKVFANGEGVPSTNKPPTAKPVIPIAYFDNELFQKSLNGYGDNGFVKFLNTLFDEQTVKSLISTYNIGTSNYSTGAVIFWYVDLYLRVNYGKIMAYNNVTGKRGKITNQCASVLEKALKRANKSLPEWLINYQNNETKINCLFGEHLLVGNDKPVAVVESEKTAIIASVYLPQFIWLACGSLTNITAARFKALAGRNVILYPDLNGFDKWAKFGNKMGFNISRILEDNATQEDKDNGLDIADYLITCVVKSFPTPIPADILDLHTKFTDAENSGILENHPGREQIRILWQAVMMYTHRPAIQSLYTDSLNAILSEMKYYTINALPNLKSA